LNASSVVIDTISYNYTTAGLKTETFTFHSYIAPTYLAVTVINNTPFDTKNYTVMSAAYNAPAAPPDDSIEAQNLTEEICIDLLETCEAQEGFVSDDRRLLEDGDYRLLE
jgi:hypothetical protein